MWTELPIATQKFSCLPPFSFYFDLIHKYWKYGAGTISDAPLHRVCTLARKMEASTVIIETALNRQDVREEIDDLDVACGQGGTAEGIIFSFFSDDIELDQVNSANPDALLGQAVLINYCPSSASSQISRSYLYEAIFRPPRLAFKELNGSPTNLLNNYIHSSGTFEINVNGQTFNLEGVYYCQQNNITGVCAHACLKMTIATVEGNSNLVTNRRINQVLGIQTPLNSGLSEQQMKEVIEDRGFRAEFYDCRTIEPNKYLALMHSLVDSGCPIIVGFTTGLQGDHVVTVFGHTFNSDEWHPQALPAYTGPVTAQYYTGSSWVDHFLIQDDNFGPYYSLSSRSLSIDPNIQVLSIIGLLPQEVPMDPILAESISTSYLGSLLPVLVNFGSGNWCDHLKTVNGPYVLRTVLIKKDVYLEHLRTIEAHDGTRIKSNELDQLNSLPDIFWMTEFSLPNLYAGNKNKLGEILIEAAVPFDSSNPMNSFIGIRGPCCMLLNDSKGNLIPYSSSIIGHGPIYRRFPHANEW